MLDRRIGSVERHTANTGLSVQTVLLATLGIPIALAATPSGLPAQVEAAAQDPSCLTTFDSVVANVQPDYAGYHDKLTGHEAELSALTDSVRAAARTAVNWGSECFPALRRWVGLFLDPHLVGPWQASPSATNATGAGPMQAAAPDSAQLPSFRVLDDSTIILRLPAIDLGLKPWIDNIISLHLQALRNTPYLIVDVRGDGGGCTCSYDLLMPFLYSKPIHHEGEDVWSSSTNIAFWRALLARDVFSDTTKAQIRSALGRMETHPNQLIALFPASEERRDTVYPLPRKVAVVIDHGCASSCEDFVLEARQSSKVVVLGEENTGGVHDYGNLRKVYLPGWRQMMIPTTRTKGPHIDFVGLPPGVRIPAGASDPVEFARQYLRSPEQS